MALGGTITASTGAGSKVYIKSDGNVGIGTTSPGAKLDVYSSSGDTKLRISKVSATTNYDLVNEGNRFSIQRASDGTRFLSVGYGGGISLGSSYATTEAGDGNLLISGNVGIGTTAPNNKLEIVGSGSNTDVLNLNKGLGTGGIRFTFDGTRYVSYIRTYESGTPANNYMSFGVNTGESTNAEIMRLQGDGNVGIGTTSPSQKLHVAGSTKTDTLGVDNAASFSGAVRLANNLQVLNKAQTDYTSLATRDTSGSEVVYNLSNIGSLTATGNVGIGTINPTNVCHVAGGSIPLRIDASGTTATTNINMIISGTMPTYGNTGSILGDPICWMNINISGTNYKLPLYI
jgi:hypothetical protein